MTSFSFHLFIARVIRFSLNIISSIAMWCDSDLTGSSPLLSTDQKRIVEFTEGEWAQGIVCWALQWVCKRKREKAERHGVWERENQAGEVSVLCVSVMYQKSALLLMFSAPVTETGGGGAAHCYVSTFSSNRFSPACSNEAASYMFLMHIFHSYIPLHA